MNHNTFIRMKKNLFALAALALVAASCTQTEIIDNDNQATTRSIGFSVYTARQTRAEAQQDVTTSNLTSFQVYAIGNGAMYFKDVTFTKNGDGVWESNPAYYWPAYKLTFCAYNKPENGTLTPEINEVVQKLTFTPSKKLAEQEDLVAAYEADKTQYGPGASAALPITFEHYLTQVIVKAKCSNTNYTVKVSGVKVTNLAGEGTYTFNDYTMAANNDKKNSTESTDYSAEFNEKTLTAEPQEVMTNGGNGRWYLIPQSVLYWTPAYGTNSSNYTYLALNVKITTKDDVKIYPKIGDEAAWIAVPLSTVSEALFVQGKKYNVTIDFFKNTGAGYVDPEEPSDLDGDGSTDPGEPIVDGQIMFQATVNDWGTDVDVNISL